MNIIKTLFAGALITVSLNGIAQSVDTSSSRETRVTTALETYRSQPSVVANQNSKYVRCDSIEKGSGRNKSKKVECSKIEEKVETPMAEPVEAQVTTEKVTTTETKVVTD